MVEALLLTFRETLEAALVVFIILSYLKKVGLSKHNNIIYGGVLTAIGASIGAAFIFEKFAGGLEGKTEEIFEGIVMLLAGILLTTMIIWMKRAKHVQHQIESRVAVELSDHHIAGLFFVTFTAVFREGVETVIFLGATAMRGGGLSLTGALLGFVIAIVLGYGFFYGAHKLSLKTFFSVTSTLLIFFAAGLMAHGIHEFQEAGLIPMLTGEAWNTNAFVDEKGMLGSILKGVFGYNGNPSILEAIVYFVYIAASFLLFV